jgi:hypothetical protein
LLLLGRRINIDASAVLIEKDFAIGQCKQGPVTALPYVDTWDEFTSTLPENDVARTNDLAAKLFQAEALAVAVTTIA